jgi:hypothetical protein
VIAAIPCELCVLCASAVLPSQNQKFTAEGAENAEVTQRKFKLHHYPHLDGVDIQNASGLLFASNRLEAQKAKFWSRSPTLAVNLQPNFL